LIQKHLTNLTSQREVKTPVKKPSPVSEREKKSTKPSSPPMEKEEPSKKSQQRPQVKKEEPKDTEPEDLEAETEAYVVKKKPTLPEELKEKLRIRTQVKQRTPTFLREEWFRYKRIPQNWRRPDGLHSKMRVNLKYRPSRVRVGFRGPKETRGLHPSGFEEIMVYTVNDLDSINPETQAARIGGTVGSKKRQAIIEKAKERDIRLLNK
jgi:large subunit ribosomal protein L32e